MKAFLRGAKNYFLQNTVFVIFLIIVAVLSFVKLAVIDGDSGYFIKIELNQLIDFTTLRYQTWASRNIIEAVLVFCCHFPFIFAITNIFFCGLLHKSILGIAKKHSRSRQLEYIVATSILASLIPASLNSAGYIPTIINYLWPASALVYTIYILKLLITQQHLVKRQYVFAALAAVFGSNSEQCAALLFGAVLVCLGFLVWQRKKKKQKIPKSIYVILAISIISLINIVICPGNTQRIAVEIAEHFPDYERLGLIDKIRLGICDIATDMLAATHPFYVAGLILLGVAIVCTKQVFKSKRRRILLSLPAFALASLLLFEYFYHKTTGDFLLTRIPHFAQHGDTTRYHLLVSAFVIIFAAYLIYCFYALNRKNILFAVTLSIILIAGILSKIIIGFSPSIFFSEFRTTMPLYIALSIIFCMQYSERQPQIRTTEARLNYSLMGVAALINTIMLFS